MKRLLFFALAIAGVLPFIAGCKDRKAKAKFGRITVRETYAPPREGPHKYALFAEGTEKPLLEDVESWKPSPDQHWLAVRLFGGGNQLADCLKGVVVQTSALPTALEWSPESTRYLAVEMRESKQSPHGHGDLHLVTIEGEGVRIETLSTGKDGPKVLFYEKSGHWSPDGSAIAFLRCRSCATASSEKHGGDKLDLYRLLLKDQRALTLIQEDVGDISLTEFAWEGDRPKLVPWKTDSKGRVK